MFLPVPYLTLIAVVFVVGGVWWWVSRMRVSPEPPPVTMMAQRIAFPGGIALHDPDRALAELAGAEEIAIPFEHAVLVIDYPLSTPASVPITAPLALGFTRGALVRAICEEYGHIYDAEEGTAAIKPLPIEERGAMQGRNRTDGAYGIWGHDLEDLVLTAARWVREPDGTVRIELHVDSKRVTGS
jgi:hypothetical protein